MGPPRNYSDPSPNRRPRNDSVGSGGSRSDSRDRGRMDRSTERFSESSFDNSRGQALVILFSVSVCHFDTTKPISQPGKKQTQKCRHIQTSIKNSLLCTAHMKFFFFKARKNQYFWNDKVYYYFITDINLNFNIAGRERSPRRNRDHHETIDLDHYEERESRVRPSGSGRDRDRGRQSGGNRSDFHSRSHNKSPDYDSSGSGEILFLSVVQSTWRKQFCIHLSVL